jgi:hypothetical protein
MNLLFASSHISPTEVLAQFPSEFEDVAFNVLSSMKDLVLDVAYICKFKIFDVLGDNIYLSN